MRTSDEIMRDIPRVVNNALCKFWEKVAQSIPEATTGSIDPTWANVFESQCSEIVTHWVENNVPLNSRNYNVNRPLDEKSREFEMEMTKLIESFGAEMQTETFDANGKELE